ASTRPAREKHQDGLHYFVIEGWVPATLASDSLRDIRATSTAHIRARVWPMQCRRDPQCRESRVSSGKIVHFSRFTLPLVTAVLQKKMTKERVTGTHQATVFLEEKLVGLIWERAGNRRRS
ncbi:unnamed protein product, partial [Ectocarpus sp. 12 AP-2014]